jgi:hypothetical protein
MAFVRASPEDAGLCNDNPEAIDSMIARTSSSKFPNFNYFWIKFFLYNEMATIFTGFFISRLFVWLF